MDVDSGLIVDQQLVQVNYEFMVKPVIAQIFSNH